MCWLFGQSKVGVLIVSKSVFIETYGCQMNVYDTELVKSILEKSGYQLTPVQTDADVVMLNTCSVREKANQKIYNRVHEIRQTRKKPSDVKVGILGCMATNFKTELFESKMFKVDFIAGPDSYKSLPQLIKETFNEGDPAYDVTLSEFETYEDVYPSRGSGVNAWIAIMRGCNNYCTFCVVPFTRGRERSRSVESVLEECHRLVKEGYKQVTLLGQNVNSYQFEESDFADLMDQVSQVPGIERIRFTSPHPKDFPEKLLKVMADRPNICKQIHLPLQAGSSRVLHKMNRTYSKEEFYEVVKQIRSYMPDISLSTDIIVGFPTETHAEFMETFEVMETVQFDSAYIFKYSERKGTTAERRFDDDVTEEDKKSRIMLLNELQRSVSLKKHQGQVGQTQRVLVEQIGSKKDPNQIQTRNDANQIVILPKGDLMVGSFCDVRITGASANVMMGELFTKH